MRVFAACALALAAVRRLKSDLVVSFAVYGPGGLANSPFLLSLRASGYRGKVVIATGMDLSPADLETLNKYDVDHKPVFTYPNRSMDTRMGPMHVQVGRYFFYEEAVKAADLTRKDRVLIADFRDVMFQDHPFENAYSRTGFFDLQFFEETSYIITASFWNWTSYWIQCCFGDAALANLESYTVLCSGTSMGTVQGIMHYLHVYIETMEARARTGTEEERSNCKNLAGVDQGIHNYVVLAGKLHKFVPVLWPNGHGPVNTVGAACSPPKRDDVPQPARPLLQDAQHYVVNNDGKRSPVVHQYDRCPELESTVLTVFEKEWKGQLDQ